MIKKFKQFKAFLPTVIYNLKRQWQHSKKLARYFTNYKGGWNWDYNEIYFNLCADPRPGYRHSYDFYRDTNALLDVKGAVQVRWWTILRYFLRDLRTLGRAAFTNYKIPPYKEWEDYKVTRIEIRRQQTKNRPTLVKDAG